MTAVDELIAFVRCCLDEDERVAREALADEPAPWRAYGSDLDAGVATADGGVIRDGDGDMRHTVAEHIARWDPARVLAEVEAKRRHIARWQEVDALLTNTHNPSAIRNELLSVRRAYMLAIQADAQPYAGQPGWREEWQLSDGA